MLSEIEFRKLFVINFNLVIIQPLFKQLMIANQMEFILFPFYVFNICRNLRFNGQLTLDCQFIYLALIKWCGYRWIKSLMCTIYIRHTHSQKNCIRFAPFILLLIWFSFCIVKYLDHLYSLLKNSCSLLHLHLPIPKTYSSTPFLH